MERTRSNSFEQLPGYGASNDILGTRVQLNGSPRVIVGVLPAGFRFGSFTPEFLIPFGNDRDKGPDNHFMNGVARLHPGVTIEPTVQFTV